MLELTLETVRDKRILVARFARRQRFLSWAIAGGGMTRGREVAWCQVTNADLPLEVDPAAVLGERLALAGVPDAVGLLTSADIGRYVQHTARSGDLEARCVATVGLGNRLRAGDSPGPSRPAGTINVLCALSRPMTERAMIEATALCAEARAVAVYESGVRSLRSGLTASGTGTDCHVIAAPDEDDGEEQGRGEPLAFVGKHTDAGYLMGQVVLAAVTLGARSWLDEYGRA
jgi:adenosylcobinamide amidohydrolase